MDSIEVAKAVGRLRRAMPRNADVLLVCEAAEHAAIRSSFALLEQKASEPCAESPDRQAHNRFMRDYMRGWRAKLKTP